MSLTHYIPGQRWFSTAEPELGLGTVLRLAGRNVQIVFTGTGVVRQYAIGSAPLARAGFRRGDHIRVDGVELAVISVEERDGLLHYLVAGDRDISEGALDPEQPVSKADTRLLSGRIDRNSQFDARFECLKQRARAQAHPGWGIIGARIDLIPHQLRVAEVAASRRPPRLLLADEVGLGKTIEACLIMAQLLASGRAARALVLVPESLMHQWFVELLRRFNLPFALFDEERCEAMEMGGDGDNPFEQEQGVIAAVDWLANDPKRRKQLITAGWDVLVVDEAHHLAWSADAPSPAYQLVDTLAQKVPAVILLTATPEQLGRSGHFARLRLLDPARYSDLDQFLQESDRYTAVSAAVDRLLSGEPLSARERTALGVLFGDEASALPDRLAAIEAADGPQRERLIDALIGDLVDRHGTGRSMVRNRRAAVGGFPRRQAVIESLAIPAEGSTLSGRLLAEFLADVEFPGQAEPEHDYLRDPRIDWLLDTLNRIAPAKALVLCRSRRKVQALEEALRVRSGLSVARFHEDMNLLQRDRNAAFFAERDGARVLIASEIGAEGRNFQFAQHLILWDLPLDPDMLEQRIGRLDRIGQRGDVNIHVAAVAGSPQEVLLRWFNEGLGAFDQIAADGRELLRAFGETVVDLAIVAAAGGGNNGNIGELTAATRRLHAELSAEIQRGRDRLLELASQRGATGGELLRGLAEDDRLAAIDDFPLRLLEQFGIHHEPLSTGMWLLDPEYLTLDAFEEFKSGPRQATFDRSIALARDDLLYLRADHPLLLSAQDLLLSSETGNAAFLLDDTLPARTVLLEAVFVLECVAQSSLHVSRFLPPEPLRAVVDTRLQLRPDFVPNQRALERSEERTVDLLRYRKLLATLVPPMLKRATEEAVAQAEQRIARAEDAAASLLGHEIDRLRALASINPAVRPDEIAALEAERDALAAVLPQARPRLDAIRLVASPDFLRIAG
jgi:ATP-dependent helicase HepA